MTVRTMNKDNDHFWGWRVFHEDDCIAKLEFCGYDYPCYIFKLVRTDQQSFNLEAIFGIYAGDPMVTFRNVRTNEVVSSVKFTIHYYCDNETISLRDLRLPPVQPSLVKRIDSFLRTVVTWLRSRI